MRAAESVTPVAHRWCRRRCDAAAGGGGECSLELVFGCCIVMMVDHGGDYDDYGD